MLSGADAPSQGPSTAPSQEPSDAEVPSTEQLAKTIGTIKSERTRVAAALKAIKEVGQVHESDTNFLLFEVGGALNGW